MKRSFREINPIDILPNPANSKDRILGDEEDLAFAENVRIHGIIEPVVVRPTADATKFMLIAGERRVWAAKEAKLPLIPAVVEELSQVDLEVERLLSENFARKNLAPWESSCKLWEILCRYREANQKVTVKEVANRVGMKYTYAHTLIQIRDKISGEESIYISQSDVLRRHLTVEQLKELMNTLTHERMDKILAWERLLQGQTAVSQGRKSVTRVLAYKRGRRRVGTCKVVLDDSIPFEEAQVPRFAIKIKRSRFLVTGSEVARDEFLSNLEKGLQDLIKRMRAGEGLDDPLVIVPTHTYHDLTDVGEGGDEGAEGGVSGADGGGSQRKRA